MTTNTLLQALAERLEIPHFRGVFMRDTLPKPNNGKLNTKGKKECGIMNFDTNDKNGSHWVCWVIDEDRLKTDGTSLFYFDSYGTAVPDELRDYLIKSTRNTNSKTTNAKILHSDFMIQKVTENSDICGELAMSVLYLMMKQNMTYKETINSIR